MTIANTHFEKVAEALNHFIHQQAAATGGTPDADDHSGETFINYPDGSALEFRLLAPYS